MFQQMTDKRVAVFLAEGFEEIEGLTVVDLLYRAGIPCDTVSVGDTESVTGSHEISVAATKPISTLDFDEYDMLVLPGGMPGTTNLGACALLTEALVRFVAEGRQVAAICAAPTVLARLGLLKDRHATCYPDMTEVLVEHGAVLEQDEVVVDGTITTSRGMGTAIAFGLSIVAHYRGQEVADALATGIVYRAEV